MLNNLIIFRIYLCIAIILLLPICYFITLELFDYIIYCFICLKDLKVIQKEEIVTSDISFLVNFFIKRQQWFKCILMLQFYQCYQKYNTSNLLGVYFHNLSYYTIARYYYLNALRYDYSLELLQNLVLVAKDLKDKEMLVNLYDQIKQVDPDNDILLDLI